MRLMPQCQLKQATIERAAGKNGAQGHCGGANSSKRAAPTSMLAAHVLVPCHHHAPSRWSHAPKLRHTAMSHKELQRSLGPPARHAHRACHRISAVKQHHASGGCSSSDIGCEQCNVRGDGCGRELDPERLRPSGTRARTRSSQRRLFAQGSDWEGFGERKRRGEGGEARVQRHKEAGGCDHQGKETRHLNQRRVGEEQRAGEGRQCRNR
mmetsp:Transcript_35876/g.76587  ORF Transcript_35876/g.76587 Transcript_35876/m.76587 type:complete len:210 (+) Transcript_35876:109-738(+)